MTPSMTAPEEGSAMDDQVELLLAERAIARVLCTYSRAADRFDLDLMRSCYWPDATDDHGSFIGDVDAFIAFVGPALQRFERTNHFLGNMLIDVDLVDDEARAETYAVAYHRFHDTVGQATDMVAGLRYVDRFERRDGEWRIAERVCAFEWRRTDPVAVEGSGFGDTYTRGLRGPDDIVWHILEPQRSKSRDA
jgi:SnoaL-like domain